MSDELEKRSMEKHPLSSTPRPPPRGADLPSDDGEPIESDRHFHQFLLLVDSLRDAWPDRDDFYVAGNMFVYYSELQSKQRDFRGPDVFVVTDTVRKEREKWVVWEEGGRTPDVVIELLSPTTEHIDRGEKMRIYSRIWKVARYYLYDPWTQVFEGYALDMGELRYRRLEPDARGYIECATLGLWLGIVHGRHADLEIPWLRWLDADGGLLLTAAEAEKRRADEEKRRADEEKRRADEAERRAAALEARLAELDRRR